MDVLVLDTIHGGRELAEHLRAQGHAVEALDVYRGRESPKRNEYDILVAPVHLDPNHPALRTRARERITHHEAVRMLLREHRPSPMVEITGAQGKTTTAFAIAHVLGGSGVLHTSLGTFLYPERELLWRRSITPASVLPAAALALGSGRWLVAEESLGVTGAGDLAVLTSARDYPIANRRRSALAVKCASLGSALRVVTTGGVPLVHPGRVVAEEVCRCTGSRCDYALGDRSGSYRNELLLLPAYRTALLLATAAACLLGSEPERLATFASLPGRMNAAREGGTLIVDNSNSGTDLSTTLDAAAYARSLGGAGGMTLVIGEERGSVCEGFPPDAIVEAIRRIGPLQVVLVGESAWGAEAWAAAEGIATLKANSLEEGKRIALGRGSGGCIVLAVKMWR